MWAVGDLTGQTKLKFIQTLPKMEWASKTGRNGPKMECPTHLCRAWSPSKPLSAYISARNTQHPTSLQTASAEQSLDARSIIEKEK